MHYALKLVLAMASPALLFMGVVMIPQGFWLPTLALLLLGYVATRAASRTDEGLALLEEWANMSEIDRGD